MSWEFQFGVTVGGLLRQVLEIYQVLWLDWEEEGPIRILIGVKFSPSSCQQLLLHQVSKTHYWLDQCPPSSISPCYPCRSGVRELTFAKRNSGVLRQLKRNSTRMVGFSLGFFNPLCPLIYSPAPLSLYSFRSSLKQWYITF